MPLMTHRKSNGTILTILPDDQDPNVYFANQPLDFKNDIGCLYVSDIPEDYHNYKIIDTELVRMSDDEIVEIARFGKILTDKERLEKKTLESLLPSQLELEQAELMIKLLPILQEVMSNE